MRPSPSAVNIAVVGALIVVTIAISQLYFRSVRIARPPVGRYNLRDVVFMMLAVVVLPPLYLEVPTWLVTAILGMVFLAVLQFTLAPILRRPLPVVVAAGVVAADVLVAYLAGEGGPGFLAFVALNDLVIAAGVIGVCNLYVQNGMRARDVAVFGVALAVYDFVATIVFPIMVDFFTRVRTLPLAPILSSGQGSSSAPIGLGDVLMLTLWTLVSYKAFGKVSAWTAGIVGLATVTTFFVLVSVGVITVGVPSMAALGPLMAIHYLYWRRRRGRERSVLEYMTSLTAGSREAPSPDGTAQLRGTIRWLREQGASLEGPMFVALWDGELLGVGPDAGEARRAARERRPGIVPVVAWVPRSRQFPGSGLAPVGIDRPESVAEDQPPHVVAREERMGEPEVDRSHVVQPADLIVGQFEFENAQRHIELIDGPGPQDGDDLGPISPGPDPPDGNLGR
jgi:hypothetical protein